MPAERTTLCQAPWRCCPGGTGLGARQSVKPFQGPLRWGERTMSTRRLMVVVAAVLHIDLVAEMQVTEIHLFN